MELCQLKTDFRSFYETNRTLKRIEPKLFNLSLTNSFMKYQTSYNYRFRWLLFLIIVLFPAVTMAQNERSEALADLKLTLDEAIHVALANNPEVNRALLSVKDADELVTIAYSEIFPDIASSVTYTRNIEIPVQFVPAQFFDPNAPEGQLAPVAFGTDNNWQGGFTVNQTLFRGETIIGLSTSTIFKTVQQENLRATSQQIVTQVRLAYYQVLVAREQLRLQEVQINRLEENLRENQARADAGIVDEYSVLQLKVQLSNQRPMLIQARYALDESMRNLKVALGLPIALEFDITGDLNSFDILSGTASNAENESLKKVDRMNTFTFSKDPADSLMLDETRGDIRLLDASLNLKDREVLAVKSRFLPTVTATYNRQWVAAEPGTPNFFQDNVRFQTLGLNVSLPIFQGLQRVANVQRTQIERKDLEEQRRAALLNARNEVMSASEAINMAFETAEARKLALEQANEGYTRAQKRLENGLGSQLEVTEAEVQVRQAEVNYALMVFEYLAAKAQYDLATGNVPYIDEVTQN